MITTRRRGERVDSGRTRASSNAQREHGPDREREPGASTSVTGPPPQVATTQRRTRRTDAVRLPRSSEDETPPFRLSRSRRATHSTRPTAARRTSPRPQHTRRRTPPRLAPSPPSRGSGQAAHANVRSRPDGLSVPYPSAGAYARFGNTAPRTNTGHDADRAAAGTRSRTRRHRGAAPLITNASHTHPVRARTSRVRGGWREALTRPTEAACIRATHERCDPAPAKRPTTATGTTCADR